MLPQEQGSNVLPNSRDRIKRVDMMAVSCLKCCKSGKSHGDY